MSRSSNILSKLLPVAVIAAVVAAVVLTPTRRHYDWDYSHLPTQNGDQPYDHKYIDEWLARSLDNGYTLERCSIYYESDPIEIRRRYPGNRLVSNLDSENLLVVQDYKWVNPNQVEDSIRSETDYTSTETYQIYGRYLVNPLYWLVERARRGGKGMYIVPSFIYIDLEQSLATIIGSDAVDLITWSDYSGYSVKEYSTDWWRSRHFDTFYVSPVHDAECDIMVNEALVPRIFAKSQPKTMIDKKNRREYIVYTPLLTKPDGEALGFKLDFNASGGTVYVYCLDMYLRNLALGIPGTDRLLAEVMGNIDDRPVTRIDYPRPDRVVRYGDNASTRGVLNSVVQNEALHLSWILLVVMALLILANGLMRRYPASKPIDVDDLDKTDFVAVREYKFRKSPMLHFLFQTSWLYRRGSNYRELFETNYRRVSRMTGREGGIELATSADDVITGAARRLAPTYGLDANSLARDLIWLRDMHLSDIHVDSDAFVRSQQIADKLTK